MGRMCVESNVKQGGVVGRMCVYWFVARVSSGRGPVNPSRAMRGVRVAWWCVAVLCVPLCVRRYGVELR